MCLISHVGTRPCQECGGSKQHVASRSSPTQSHILSTPFRSNYRLPGTQGGGKRSNYIRRVIKWQLATKCPAPHRISCVLPSLQPSGYRSPTLQGEDPGEDLHPPAQVTARHKLVVKNVDCQPSCLGSKCSPNAYQPAKLATVLNPFCTSGSSSANWGDSCCYHTAWGA